MDYPCKGYCPRSIGSISFQWINLGPVDESNCNFLVQILDGPDSFRQNYEPVLDHFYYFNANSKCKHWVFFRNNDFPFTDYISLIVPYFPHTLCRALTIDLTHCMSLCSPPFHEKKIQNIPFVIDSLATSSCVRLQLLSCDLKFSVSIFIFYE